MKYAINALSDYNVTNSSFNYRCHHLLFGVIETEISS